MKVLEPDLPKGDLSVRLALSIYLARMRKGQTRLPTPVRSILLRWIKQQLQSVPKKGSKKIEIALSRTAGMVLSGFVAFKKPKVYQPRNQRDRKEASKR